MTEDELLNYIEGWLAIHLPSITPLSKVIKRDDLTYMYLKTELDELGELIDKFPDTYAVFSEEDIKRVLKKENAYITDESLHSKMEYHCKSFPIGSRTYWYFK